MKSGTVATHLDDATLARLKQTARTENRSFSQLQIVALKALLDLPPAHGGRCSRLMELPKKKSGCWPAKSSDVRRSSPMSEFWTLRAGYPRA